MKCSWIGHRGPFGRNVKWTSPQLPGVVVRDCVHPTALRPYYIEGQRGTFPRLDEAKAAAISTCSPPNAELASRAADDLAAQRVSVGQPDLFLPVGTQPGRSTP